MKRLILTLTMVFAMGLSLQGVAAQVSPGSGTETDDIDGLASAYSRTFNNETQEIQIQAYTFEDEDGASELTGVLRDELEVEGEAELGEIGELQFSDMESLDAEGFEMTFSTNDGEFVIKYLGFTKDETAFAVMVLDADLDSATELATGIGEHILESNIENDEVDFTDDGTATGGVFDLLPSEGDDVVDGLKFGSDTDLMD